MATKQATKQEVRVRMIQTVDSEPGKDITVYFTDGSRAVVKRGTKLSAFLAEPSEDIVAPNIVKVTMRGQSVLSIKPVEVDNPDE